VVALEASPCPANLACLALAAVFPGSVYEHTLFPVSLAVASSPDVPGPGGPRALDRRRARRGRPDRRLVIVGLLAVMGRQQAETGRWDGFLLVEAKYGTGLHDPAATFAKNAVRPPGTSGGSLAGQLAPATGSGWSPSSPSWVWPRPSLLASAPRLTWPCWSTRSSSGWRRWSPAATWPSTGCTP
jgi:hypothetical protein